MSGQPQTGQKMITETRVKQGFRGRHVLIILISSLALAGVAAVVLGLIQF